MATNDVMLDGPSGGGAVDPMVAMVRISLLCPITGRRMRIPARGQDCKHIQVSFSVLPCEFHCLLTDLSILMRLV